jgi:uncharacterized protein
MNKELAVKDSIFKIGKVISVDGRKIKVSVDKKKNTSNLLYDGEVIKNISVGGYIKIIKGFINIIGKVEGEYIIEDKQYYSKEYHSLKDLVNRTLVVSLLGYFNSDKFERGIKELPLIDNECYLLDKNEFNLVHNFVSKRDEPLTIGNLSLEKGQKISIGINSLFASHIGIFGNTGSGKSYTLAKIYRELFLKFGEKEKFRSNAKFILLDFNGEYINKNVIIEEKFKNRFELSTRKSINKFPIYEETVKSSTFWSVILEATEKTQTPFLRRAINKDFTNKSTNSDIAIKSFVKDILVHITTQADKGFDKLLIHNFLFEIYNCLTDKINFIIDLIKDYEKSLQWHNVNNTYFYQFPSTRMFAADPNFIKNIIYDKVDNISIDYNALTELEKLHLSIIFKYYDEILKGFSNKEHIAPLIGRLDKRIKDLEKIIEISPDNLFADGKPNITIVSLRDVNIHMKKLLPLLICKQLYDDKKNINKEGSSLNIIIDEAHNILSHISERESETWKDYRLETFEEIIKEGRKFGVFLTIASQRPADISPTIISQLHNYFLHRLINNNDINAVEKAILYLDKVSFDYLPILPTGTCIFAGISAQVPVVIDIGKIKDENEPENKTIEMLKHWKDN